MIECRGVTKSYRNHTAVSAIDFTIDGGICGLLGANGAGKSTLLKLMTGQLAPDQGTVLIDGLDVATRTVEVMQRIGVVPEELGLFETLTVAENLLLTGPLYGLSAVQTRERAADLLRALDLSAAEDRFVSQCSYGMRKKTALAMALLHGPSVLFLDEPFEGIDPSSSQVIQTMLREAAKHGVTVLLTSHDLHLVETLADRIFILKDATIAFDSANSAGPAVELQNRYFKLVGNPVHEALSWLGS